ncbi:nucleoside diphosphatase [Scheffersomyces coipomensis]|uniref:nucleoside diphosphatase n=1 Tax=Scheffersomyces coipomensis TaxID=1788519 RepID=UPI00315D6F60
MDERDNGKSSSGDSGDYKYGIVIDSGSSGSRIQIYSWEDPAKTLKSSSQDDKVTLLSPPKIIQKKDWSMKISPGISSFHSTTKKIWSQHYSKLMKFAQDIIPVERHADTPIFVLSTAGMRLVEPKQQKKILEETCSSIQKNTQFYLPNCKEFVQIIDGETEGVYGWLGLNYLMGQFNKYDPQSNEHESIGFMDMGGASTQIAFVPSSAEEVKKHKEDLSTVTLRNIDGTTQEWNVFVETWLGFGANEARKRYLEQLINLSHINPSVGNEISDPCLPKGAKLNYEFESKTYKVNGIGNYQQCVRTMYPLLLKNIPCKDEPCFFNGIHGPKLNFDKDKFVGISEYWYTANDIFQSGGEYNFHGFNEKVRDYCESDWESILSRSKYGEFSNLDPDKFLKDACFKASWVMNILHEGFELPRLGLDIPDDDNSEGDESRKEIANVHVPFKSADSINGEELSWTLGKISLVASSQIKSSEKNSKYNIGIYPSKISGKSFVSGSGIHSGKASGYGSDDDDGEDISPKSVFSILLVLLLLYFIYHYGKAHFGTLQHKFRRFQLPYPIKRAIVTTTSKIPGLKNVINDYQFFRNEDNLDESILPMTSTTTNHQNSKQYASVLRTRSNINLTDEDQQERTGSPFTSPEPQSQQSQQTKNLNTFINKPFVVPKRSGVYHHLSETNSKDTLNRIPSASSINRGKTPN